MRKFYHRVLGTFGSPFRINKIRSLRRNAEKTLESQTGPFQSGSKEEAQLTDAPQDNAALLAKPISIVPQEVVTAKDIPPSIASTENADKLESDDYRQSPPAKADGKNGLQLTEGSSRIVMANDGTKDCMALLLTKELIMEFKYIIAETRELETAEDKRYKASRKATDAELEAKAIQSEAERTKDPDLIRDLPKSIEIQTQIFVENTARADSLSTKVFIRRANLTHSQNAFQRIFRNALQEIDLSALPAVDMEYPGPSVAVEDEQESIAESETDESMISVESLFRHNAARDMDSAVHALQERRAVFENRHNDYDRELEQFLFALSNGTTGCTRSLFDRYAFVDGQELTRALIEAEADHESAMKRAKALGVLENGYDQESNFVSDISDGYYESFEAEMKAAVDKTSIRSWTDKIVCSQPEELEERQEADDWDAKSIDISDSISLVDHTRNRKRIDRWRDICGW